MSIVLLVLAGLLLACGAVACVIPVLPGPLVSFRGLLCLIPTACKPSVFTLVVFGLVTAVAIALDYLSQVNQRFGGVLLAVVINRMSGRRLIAENCLCK